MMPAGSIPVISSAVIPVSITRPPGRGSQRVISVRKAFTVSRLSTTLRLPRLGAAEVAALAAACRGGRPIRSEDAAGLLAWSEGLPFVVEELLASDGVPPTLAGLVAGRLAALSSAQREVLATLRAAVDVGLLATGQQLSWSHALTRDAVRLTLLVGTDGPDGPVPSPEPRWPHSSPDAS